MIKSICSLFFLCSCISIHGQTWKPLGPFGSDKYSLKTSAWGGGTGQIHAFAFAAQGNGKYDWYCAAPWGGIWKSTDEGHSWIDINPQLEKVAGICSAIDIAIDPRKPSMLYVTNGTLDRNHQIYAPMLPSTGVFFSTDRGASCRHTGLTFNYEDNNHIRRLLVNPHTKGGALQLFAATDRGLFMSRENVEKKWIRVLNDDKIYAVEVSPDFEKNNTIYASGEDVFISNKGGRKNTFTPIEPSVNTILPAMKEHRTINIAVANRSGHDVLYALVFQDGVDYFLCYENGKWEIRKTPMVEGVFIPAANRLKMAVQQGNADKIYVGITYVSFTEDGGKSWQLAGKYCQPGSQNDPLNIHGDIHAVSMIPGTNDVLIGTDGGVFRYMAAEKRTIELNNGLNISQVVGMSAPRQAPYKIMTGKQDTGFDIYDGTEWTNFMGGDGLTVAASPVDSTLYLCNMGYKFRVRNNKPIIENNPGCKNGENALYAWVAYDPVDKERCFIAGTDISYTDDGAKNFTTLYKYHSAVRQPVDFESQMENIVVSHDQTTGESIVYATNYGFTNGSVCKMIRGRINIPKGNTKGCEENLCSSCWVKIPLPNERMEWLDNTAYSVSSIAVSPADPDELWICYEHNTYDKDDLKVFHSVDGGATWNDMNRGLPAYTSCTAIRYDEVTHYLYLGTSRGIYVNDGNGWKPFGSGLPASYVKVLEINQGIRKIRAALYGRGVWECDLLNK